MKKILYGDEARAKTLEGVEAIAKAVKVTLGPSGRNVLIRNKSELRPFSTKDGVTVAAQIGDEDSFLQAAIESMQDVANSSDEMAGDGTTTATILAEAILKQGIKTFDPKHKNIFWKIVSLFVKNNKNLNLLDIKRGIDEAVKVIVEVLKENRIDCKDDLEMLKQVALIASNYDNESADIVTKAFKVAGNQGIVNIKRSRTYETYLTTIKGMTLPMGYKSNYYITDHKSDMCEFENPYVYITNNKIDKMTPNLGALLEQVAENDDALVIICQDMEMNISDMLIRNKMDANFKICVCKAPDFGVQQIEILRDLGTVLGKDPFLKNEGIDFEALPKEEILKHIPRSEAVMIGINQTSIKGATGTKEELKVICENMDARANMLRDKLTDHVNVYEKGILQTRISRLSDGIAYINIGAVTDTEFIEKQARIQDALYSIKCASEEGIIPGGGSALYSISRMELISRSDNPSVQYGIDIVMKAIQMPFLQIVKNVGIELSDVKLKEVKNTFKIGFDARKQIIVPDMIKAGIIDPVKVTRVALQNAASIAGMLLTTECLVVDTEVYDKPPQPQY